MFAEIANNEHFLGLSTVILGAPFILFHQTQIFFVVEKWTTIFSVEK